MPNVTTKLYKDGDYCLVAPNQQKGFIADGWSLTKEAPEVKDDLEDDLEEDVDTDEDADDDSKDEPKTEDKPKVDKPKKAKAIKTAKKAIKKKGK